MTNREAGKINCSDYDSGKACDKDDVNGKGELENIRREDRQISDNACGCVRLFGESDFYAYICLHLRVCL